MGGGLPLLHMAESKVSWKHLAPLLARRTKLVRYLAIHLPWQQDYATLNEIEKLNSL